MAADAIQKYPDVLLQLPSYDGVTVSRQPTRDIRAHMASHLMSTRP